MNPESTLAPGSAAEPRFLLVPYRDDPLAALADRLIADFRDTLPMLDQAIVLLPGLEPAPRLRRLLLDRAKAGGHSALLGPRIMRLRDWVAAQPMDGPPVISEHARELVLVEALREHGQLFGSGNVWALADSLLTLFDELTLNKVGLPESLEAFTARLAQGYGPDARRHLALDMEAKLVHTLWHAWHRQLEGLGFIDRNTAHLLRLNGRLSQDSDSIIYLAGFHRFDAAEIEWLRSMLERDSVRCLLHGQASVCAEADYHPDVPVGRLLSLLDTRPVVTSGGNTDGYFHFLEAVFAPEGEPLAERSRAFAQAVPQSPAAGLIRVVAASGAEEEARVVDLQVRIWLLEGRRNIAIVTENRRLARRVRALLERAGVTLQDSGGWALSTTSAAAALERWLECVEEDFPHLAMLDLLKSPFLDSGQGERHLETVYRLEQDIVLRENVGRSLQRYKTHLGYRRRRLPEEMAPAFDDMAALLDRLDQAAAPLRAHVAGSAAHRPDRILDALLESMNRLGMDQSMAKDAAGARLLEELGQMRRAVLADAEPMAWLEFRAWLGRTLERYNFRPSVSGQPVQLMGLNETALGRFDGLIIAGAEQGYLPGSGKSSPFFNDAVRRELGLPALAGQLAERFYHFRRLLESAPQVLVTLRGEQDGEEIMPSPWVEAIEAFHRLAYGCGLGDPDGLLELVRQPGTCVVDDGSPLPGTVKPPRPRLEPGLVPESMSASAYQQLMDCPYQFFAGRGLGLAPPDTIREALQKSDFGERVHRCLEAFHSDVKGLPGPFKGEITAASRSAAEDLLRKISLAVFADDLDDNFLHRDWLHRWLEMIGPYLDWEVERAGRWRVHAAEVKAVRAAGGFEMKGRLDRIDIGPEGLGVVDYKTGFTPREAEVLAGESVQLPCYAILAEDVCGSPLERVEYLALDRERLGSRTVLEGDALHELTRDVDARLGMLMGSLRSGAALPAWGDEETCGRCAMESICRRQSWESE